MGPEKLLNDSTLLRQTSISIDGFSLIPDDIITLEFSQDLFEFGIEGTLKIKDSFDIFNNGEIRFIKDNKITVYIEDFLQKKSIRTYYITDVRTIQQNERFKILDISFIDEITYKLKNTYLSKSFNSTPVAAFQEYLEHLGINDLLTASKLTTNIIDTSTVTSFVVPQDRNVLNFFMYLFKRYNIHMYQDLNSLNITEIIPSSLTLKQLDGNNVLYTNATLNNGYMFKIHEYESVTNQTYSSNLSKPAEMIYRYDTEKVITKDTFNLVDVYNDLKINNLDMSTVQPGNKFSTQASTSTDKRKYELFNEFINNSELAVVVPGSVEFGNIVSLINTEFSGNPLFSDTAHERDFYMSGKYIITKVSSRLLGDRFIQKLTCSRLDHQTPRKYL